MRRLLQILFAAHVAFAASQAAAAPAAVVEGVQMPAWLERQASAASGASRLRPAWSCAAATR